MSTPNRLAARPIIIGKHGLSHIAAGLYLDDDRTALALGGATACGDLDPEYEWPIPESAGDLRDVTCTRCRAAAERAYQEGSR